MPSSSGHIIFCISKKSHFKAIYLYSFAKFLIFMHDKLKLPFVVAIGQQSISSKGTKVTTNSTSTCHTLLRVYALSEKTYNIARRNRCLIACTA